jgi:hypothetical protein
VAALCPQGRSRGGAGRERKDASGHPAAGGGGTGRRRLGPRASEGKPPSTVPLASSAGAAVSRRAGSFPLRRPAQRAAGERPHGTCDRVTPVQAGSCRAFSSRLAASKRGVADLVVATTKRAQRRGARGRSCAIPPLSRRRGAHNLLENPGGRSERSGPSGTAGRPEVLLEAGLTVPEGCGRRPRICLTTADRRVRPRAGLVGRRRRGRPGRPAPPAAARRRRARASPAPTAAPAPAGRGRCK